MWKKMCQLVKKSEQGFSMIELLVYIAIVGVLVAFAAPRYSNSLAMANTAKIQADLQTLNAAITMYQLQNGTLPTSIENDLGDYVAHLDKLEPPKGKCITKEKGITDIEATEYVIVSGKDEASFQNMTLDEFGKKSASTGSAS